MKKSSSSRTLGAFSVLSAIVFLAWGAAGAAPGPQNVPGYSVETVSGGGTIAGKILYRGKPIRPRRINVTQDPSVCGRVKEIYPAEVEAGGVVGAVVWIDDITRGKAFSLPAAVLDQKKCQFVPDLVLMAPGQLKVVNSDDATHNVHIFAHANRESNQMMAPEQSPIELPFMRPDQITVRCDIHTWMQGYIVVAKNPYYALSGSGGAFQLTNVPPGKYRVKVWQPALGTAEQEVTVAAGKTVTLDFTMGLK